MHVVGAVNLSKSGCNLLANDDCVARKIYAALSGLEQSWPIPEALPQAALFAPFRRSAFQMESLSDEEPSGGRMGVDCGLQSDKFVEDLWP